MGEGCWIDKYEKYERFFHELKKRNKEKLYTVVGNIVYLSYPSRTPYFTARLMIKKKSQKLLGQMVQGRFKIVTFIGTVDFCINKSMVLSSVKSVTFVGTTD